MHFNHRRILRAIAAGVVLSGCSSKVLLGGETTDAANVPSLDAASSPDASAPDASSQNVSPQLDAASPPDVALPSDAASPAASFQFIVDGVVQTPMSCPSDHWEFPYPPPLSLTPNSYGSCPMPPPCPGATVVLTNTSEFPMAYLAQWQWGDGVAYVPGVATGDPDQLAGVMAPGEQVDITSVYLGGFVALLGSPVPFSTAAAITYVSDEGVIPWPASVPASDESDQMWIAEIEIRSSCTAASRHW